jgi:hypothetical protein
MASAYETAADRRPRERERVAQQRSCVDLEPDVTLAVADDFAPSRIGTAEDLGDVPRARLDLFQQSLHAEPG